MYKTVHFPIQKRMEIGENLTKVHIFFRVLAIGLGILHVYAAIKSQSMNADGISYLDIGDAYFRGDWVNAINPVWSPLYSWILGFANFVLRPSMQWEFPVVHIMNLLIYLGTLWDFEYMWSRIRFYPSTAEETNTVRIPGWLWWTLGYLLFIWTALSLIQIWSVTPDMLMAGLVFLAAGLIAKMRAGDESLRTFVSLGVVLGLGYLSKTFMFSLAPIFLLISIVVVRRKSNVISKLALATGVFFAISLPFILLISDKKDKLTIGEAGTVTYVRYVNGIPFPHWQGDALAGIVPTHPSRIVHQSPPLYEFGEPIGGTYPISMDPSYWYEGINPRFDFGRVLARLFASGLVYMELFFQKQGILFACVLGLYLMNYRKEYSFVEILRQWALVIPAAVAFGLYGIVLVQDRYLGMFVLLFWADILANIRLPYAVTSRSWLNVLCLISIMGLLANIILFNIDGFNRFESSLQVSLAEPSAPAAKPLEVAMTLRDLGIEQGEKVGVIGYAYDSFWARLARVKIVAEMLEVDAVDLWHDQALQQEVLRAFASTSARAVVAEYVPAHAKMNSWHQVGDSNYFIYRFEE